MSGRGAPWAGTWIHQANGYTSTPSDAVLECGAERGGTPTPSTTTKDRLLLSQGQDVGSIARWFVNEGHDTSLPVWYHRGVTRMSPKLLWGQNTTRISRSHCLIIEGRQSALAGARLRSLRRGPPAHGNCGKARSGRADGSCRAARAQEEEGASPCRIQESTV